MKISHALLVGGQAGRRIGIFAKRTHLKNERSPAKSGKVRLKKVKVSQAKEIWVNPTESNLIQANPT
ncbi:MAG: hypothetical protein ABR955_15820 [Verrucomicrobiota bacterium]